MDYRTIYKELCARGQTNRNLVCYTEKHHIIPKCLGGTNTVSNLTVLSSREHFIAHRLLVKIYNLPKLWYALFNMTVRQPKGQRNQINSRLYEAIREQVNRVRCSPEQRNLVASKSRGNTNVRGKKWWFNEQSDLYIRCEQSPGSGWVNKGLPASQKQKEAVSAVMSSRVVTDVTKQKLSIAAKNRVVTNNKGTIWVVNDNGTRKRVFPTNIPEGFVPVNKNKD